MKFGLSIEIQEGLSYAETLALARTAEEAGFDTALLAEHYYPCSGRLERMAADAWIFLAALARDTQRVRLGTLVSPVAFRHPSVLAKMATSLDHVSAGRAELGLGAGWDASEHAAYGFDFPDGPERVNLLEEQLQVIAGLWSQDPFSYDGPHYHLRDCHFTPANVQRPRPTLLVGGRPTSRRIPRLAARYADDYTVGGTPEECRATRSMLDRACEQAGRDPASLALSLFAHLCVAETEHDVGRLTESLRAFDPRYLRRPEGAIVGTPDQAAERARAYAEAGVTRILLSVEGEAHRQMLPLIGERIAPLIG